MPRRASLLPDSAETAYDGVYAMWRREVWGEGLTPAAEFPAPPPAPTLADAPPLHEWARRYCRIIHPVRGEIAFDPRPYQDRLWADTSQRRLILKARQVGMSTAIAVEALYYAHFQPDSLHLFVSRNLDLAQDLVSACRAALRGMPEEYQPISQHRSGMQFDNGSAIRSVAATANAARGKPATRLYLDEFAFMAWAADIFTAAMPTISTGGKITVLSTPRGRSNLFYRLWDGQEGGGRLPLTREVPALVPPHMRPLLAGGDRAGQWSPHYVHWSECYTEEWATIMRATMTGSRWAQEYDADFISSGTPVFSPEDLAMCRVGWNPDPAHGFRRFVSGWDIGRRQDPTVGLTFGERGVEGEPSWWHLIAAYRDWQPFYVQAQVIAARWRRYGIRPYDRTRVEWNGIGDPLLEMLDVPVKWKPDELPRPGTPQGVRHTSPRHAREAPNWVEPFRTTGHSKPQAIEALQMLIEHHRFKHQHPQLEQELALYEWDDEDLTQDCVMAAAFVAYEIITLGKPRDAAVPATGPAHPAIVGYEERVSRVMLPDALLRRSDRMGGLPSMHGLGPDPALTGRRRRN